VAAAARRRATPGRALAGLLAVLLAAVAGLVSPGVADPPERGARWAAAPEPAERSNPVPAPAPAPAPARQPPRPVLARPATPPPADPSGDFVGWAVLDLASGSLTGSGNAAELSTTASMIKSWLVADRLRRATETGTRPGPDRLAELRTIIRDSDNPLTHALFAELGADASIERMIEICGLTDSEPVPGRWSNTRMSPRDTARMAGCLADGRGAGPEWTGWLLAELRAVHGPGDFGIRHAFPPDRRATIAIKNGWVVRDAQHAWHVSCLAIGDGWTMGVLARYPERLGLAYGAELCRSLAATHLSP
jgi:hypothetical protein